MGDVLRATPGRRRKFRAEPWHAATAHAHSQCSGVIAVGHVRTAVAVDVGETDSIEVALEIIGRVLGRGDARDRVVLVHHQVFAPVAVEIDVLAGTSEELAALRSLISDRGCLLVEHHLICGESATRQRVAHEHGEAVPGVGVNLRPGKVTESIAIHVHTAVVHDLRSRRETSRERRAEASRVTWDDGPLPCRGEHQEIGATIAVVVEGCAYAIGSSDLRRDLRAESVSREAEPVAQIHRRGRRAAGPDEIAAAVAIDVRHRPEPALGHCGRARNRSRETLLSPETGHAVLPAEVRRGETVAAASAAFLDRCQPAAPAGGQRRLVAEVVAPQDCAAVENIDPIETNDLADARAGDISDIHLVARAAFIDERDLVRCRNASTGIRVVADRGDPEATVRDVLEVLEVDHIARAVANSIQRPGPGGHCRVDDAAARVDA